MMLKKSIFPIALAGIILSVCPLASFSASKTTTEPASSNKAPAATMTNTTMNTTATPTGTDTPQARQSAAQAYLKIQPVAQMYQDTIEELAVQVPAEKQPEFKKMMTESVDMPKLEQLALSSLVKNFTVSELNSMTEFYGSEKGQAIYRKFPNYLSDIGQGLRDVIHIPDSAKAPATTTAPSATGATTPSQKMAKPAAAPKK